MLSMLAALAIGTIATLARYQPTIVIMVAVTYKCNITGSRWITLPACNLFGYVKLASTIYGFAFISTRFNISFWIEIKLFKHLKTKI